jgi:hypothetical protein
MSDLVHIHRIFQPALLLRGNRLEVRVVWVDGVCLDGQMQVLTCFIRSIEEQQASGTVEKELTLLQFFAVDDRKAWYAESGVQHKQN